MPIYEYICERCDKLTTFLVLRPDDRPVCEFCGGEELVRVLSRVAHHRTEASRLKEFNTGKQQNADFYRDPSNIGLWAKKRAKELGVDLGSKVDDTIEKARSGKLEDLGID